jgi:hypothetical protein
MKGSQNRSNRPEFCDASHQIKESRVTKNRTHIHLAIGSRFERDSEGIGSDSKIPELWMRIFWVWHRSRPGNHQNFRLPPGAFKTRHLRCHPAHHSFAFRSAGQTGWGCCKV